MTDKRGSSSLPEGWQNSKLDELTQFVNGKAHENSISEDGNYVVVNFKFISSEGEVVKYSDECFCPAQQDDVLIVMSDVPNGRAIAKCFYVDNDDKYTVNQRIGILRAKRSDPKFLYYSVNRNAYFLSFDDGIKQTNLRKDEVLSCPIILPPLEEQRKIAEILSAWDEAIAQQTRLLELKRERKRGLMQQLLTGRVRFKEFAGLEWRKATFNDVLKLEIGGTPARKEPKYWDSERSTENYWLSISDLKGKNIFSTKERITDLGARKSNTKLIPAGSLVMSFKLTIGRRAILGLPMYTNEAICALIPKDSRVVDVEFLYQYLEVVDFEQGIDQAVKGKTLNKEKIKLLQLSLPTIEEQQKIATVLSAADAEIETLTAQLAAFRVQKRGLMQRLLTGKTRVQVA